MTTNPNAHVLRCPTRWSDVDENGHINNARLVGYIQEGIYDLFNHHAKAARESLFPAGFLIARHEIDYLQQLHHRPEPLLVRLMVERLGRSSAHVRVDVCRDPFTYMTARTVVVARDQASGRSRKLSQPERRFLSEYMTVAPVSEAQTPSPVIPAQVRPVPVRPVSVRPASAVPGKAVPTRVTPKVMASRQLAIRQVMPRQSAPKQPVVHPMGYAGPVHKVPLPSRPSARALCRV